MKVFVSVDLEGATGTADPEEMRPGRDGYEATRRWMASDANAAIAGARWQTPDALKALDVLVATTTLAVAIGQPAPYS